MTWSVGLISEAKGQQSLWQKTRPEIIKKLQESALIQSAESSNRIEGVEVEPHRLLPLILGKSKPQDRPEEEIVGYRRALEFIHKNHSKLKVTPEIIKQLHRLCQGGMISDAGQLKSKDNEIIEFNQQGDRKVRFKCVSAKETPQALQNLCDRYSDLSQQDYFPDILNIANFIFDFLCIHPFRDGNGRISRLLTLLCLYQNKYQIGQFVSLEKIIEQSKNDYYEALGSSSQGWHKSNHDLYSWWAFFLSHIKQGYQDLKNRVDLSVSDGDSAASLIRQQVLSMESDFKISDLMNLNPAVHRETIKKVLTQLKKEKKIKLLGSGKGSSWKKTRS